MLLPLALGTVATIATAQVAPATYDRQTLDLRDAATVAAKVHFINGLRHGAQGFSLAEGALRGEIELEPVTAGIAFNAVSAKWAAALPDGARIDLEIATRSADGDWSMWYPLPVDGDAQQPEGFDLWQDLPSGWELIYGGLHFRREADGRQARARLTVDARACAHPEALRLGALALFFVDSTLRGEQVAVPQPSPELDPLRKSVLPYFFLNPELVARARAEQALSESELAIVRRIAREEAATLADLKSWSDDLIDAAEGEEAAREAIAASGYEQLLHSTLNRSWNRVRENLGAARTSELLEWMRQVWREERARHSRPNRVHMDGNVRLTVFMTQFDSQSGYEIALPDKYVKFANLGWEYHPGYENPPYNARLDYNGQSVASVGVLDVGPWNIDDNYWNAPDHPQRPRRMWTDLPTGMPEAQAAYFDNYNGGLDQYGRTVLNPGGCDAAFDVAADLGLGYLENAWVDVTYLWEEQTGSGGPLSVQVLPDDPQPIVADPGYDLFGNRVTRNEGADAVHVRWVTEVRNSQGQLMASWYHKGGWDVTRRILGNETRTHRGYLGVPGSAEGDDYTYQVSVYNDDTGELQDTDTIPFTVTGGGGGGGDPFPKPHVYSRDEWGAMPPTCQYSYCNVTHLALHHTAGSGYEANSFDDCAAAVRAVQILHMNDRGWCDIGYQYLACANGMLFEGRGGGDDVVGAHDKMNCGSMAVSAIGYYHEPYNNQPTPELLNGIDDLFAWKADQKGIDPHGTSYYEGYGQNQTNIYGHRDIVCPTCGTECPGDLLYVELPGIRDAVDARINSGAGAEGWTQSWIEVPAQP